MAVAGVAVVGVAVVGAAVVAAGLVWLGSGLVPQLVSMKSRQTARIAAKPDRPAWWSRIWVSPKKRGVSMHATPASQRIEGDQPIASNRG
jgi:hypothetical protein